MEEKYLHRMIAWRPVYCTFILAFLCLAGQPMQGFAKETDTVYKWSGNGLRLELAPLPSDQVRAFFIGRGFALKDANFIAQTGCVFRSALGNAGNSIHDPGITIKLKKWRVIKNKAAKSLMTREDWSNVWRTRKVRETPKVAFHWSLFPTEQDYNPTDYNWGMITFALPQGTKFDLEVVWNKSGSEQRHLLRELECGQ